MNSSYILQLPFSQGSYRLFFNYFVSTVISQAIMILFAPLKLFCSSLHLNSPSFPLSCQHRNQYYLLQYLYYIITSQISRLISETSQLSKRLSCVQILQHRAYNRWFSYLTFLQVNCLLKLDCQQISLYDCFLLRF